MNQTGSKFNLIAAYVAIIGIATKILHVILEAFFAAEFEGGGFFEFLNSDVVKRNIPIFFNWIILLFFLVLIARYYSGSAIEIAADDPIWESSNIKPLDNNRNYINIWRINEVIKEFIYYTCMFIFFLFIYYMVEFAFINWILPVDREIDYGEISLIKTFIALKITIEDATNIISTLPLFMCFRILFLNLFPDDIQQNSRIPNERTLFKALIAVCIIFSFLEFSYLSCFSLKEFNISNAIKVDTLTKYMLQSSYIPFYRFAIGILAGLSMALLIGRIIAMDYIFDFKFPKNSVINYILNLLIKLLPLYAVIQPFYVFFIFGDVITDPANSNSYTRVDIFAPLESLTYYLTGFGKLIYFIFIVYLIDRREFHKFLYLIIALKDSKAYNLYIERHSMNPDQAP